MPASPNAPPLLSLVQVAERLNVSRQAVLYRKHGSLPGVRVGNSWAVLVAAATSRRLV